MVKSISLLPLGFVAAAAFTGQPLVSRQAAPSSSLHMGGASGFATSREGKTEKIDAVKGLLEKSQMIFTVPSGSVTVGEAQALRRSMPEGTSCSVIKNTLMTRAIAGTEYESAASMLKGGNMWFFIEDDISASLKAYTAFLKTSGKRETHQVMGGVLEGAAFDSAGVDAISKLPTKDELYARIAGSIKAVPTKVARVIKAPNSKLARAIKLATDENNA